LASLKARLVLSDHGKYYDRLNHRLLSGLEEGAFIDEKSKGDTIVEQIRYRIEHDKKIAVFEIDTPMGLDPWEIDRLAVEAGFPQGPLHVYGTAGGNVIYHAGLFIQSRRPDIFSVPNILIRLYEAGYVGAGKPCFYREGLKPDTSVLDYIRRDPSLPVPGREEAKDMLLLSMVNQAFMCLDDGVVKDYYSMDIGAILGIGFPDCWHGPGRYVSQNGVRATRKRLGEIYDRYSLPFFRPAEEFERLIACGVDRGLI
jgi:3-hydroxyacyl-CoA dehydrogenase/enoyl-CoA hydratase/3-hydroxybutyryl-CoA epimerase